MISENRRARAHIDWPLIAMIAMLAIFGVYAVCVATFAAGGDPDAPLLNQIVGSSYARNQSIFLAVGAVVAVVAGVETLSAISSQPRSLALSI